MATKCSLIEQQHFTSNLHRMLGKVPSLRQKTLKTPSPSEENLDPWVVERCRVGQGSIITYRSGSCTLIRVDAIGLGMGTGGVLVQHSMITLMFPQQL